MDSSEDATKQRGAFIVLEGLDRSGKTTQAALLAERLEREGRAVKTMRFPDRTTVIGQMIDGYLKSNVEMEDHVIHLLFSANRWEAAKQIHSLLATGTTIVCDRYVHSGIAYSVAKGNMTREWARAPDVGLPRPDVVVFLDVADGVARQRGGWGGEVYEREEMQGKVRRVFEGMAGDGEVVVVDAGGGVEDVAEMVWRVVKERVGGELGGVRVVE